MTVFKTFWKILNKNKVLIIGYTALLLIFGINNIKTSDNSMSFIPKKPDIMIINNDKEIGITKDFIKYLKENCNIKDIGETEETIKDALFYREINYIIYIPEKYNEKFLNGDNPEIEIKSSGDYQASYAEILVSRYLQVANLYQKTINNEDEIIKKINETLSDQIDVEIVSKVDTTVLEKVTFYYNFASYSLLACLIFIIGLVLNSFNNDNIRKRSIISSMNYKIHNRILLISNCFYSIIIWLIYNVISFIIFKDAMFSKLGGIYILNSFIFVFCITTFSFLIGNLVNNKNALSGIVNVISLGSSFLCGAFVPIYFLPDFVIKIAHIFPTYYYISTNESLTTLQEFNGKTLKPIITNMFMMIVFAIIFILLTNIIVKRKRKIG